MDSTKLLIIDTHPFGTLTDSYKWCQYLREQFDVTLICLDDKEHLDMPGVQIIRVRNKRNKLIRGCSYLLCCLRHLLLFEGKIIVVYFEHCILLKELLPWKKMHLDIRTIAVWGDQDTRERFDAGIRRACLKYDTVSVISDGVKKKLGIEKAWILPLGSDVISSTPKKYTPLRLLYVGSFSYRQIEDTINGFAMFARAYPQVDIHYDLIGKGLHNELDECIVLAQKLGVSKHVTFHGRLNYNLLKPFFDKAGIGISYVPITSFYNVQPPTKTFEYILSGLFCIATATEENKKIISEDNGILIQDNAFSFFKGLEFIYNHTNHINEEMVRQSLKDYTWDCIVEKKLIPMLLED